MENISEKSIKMLRLGKENAKMYEITGLEDWKSIEHNYVMGN